MAYPYLSLMKRWTVESKKKLLSLLEWKKQLAKASSQKSPFKSLLSRNRYCYVSEILEPITRYIPRFYKLADPCDPRPIIDQPIVVYHDGQPINCRYCQGDHKIEYCPIIMRKSQPQEKRDSFSEVGQQGEEEEDPNEETDKTDHSSMSITKPMTVNQTNVVTDRSASLKHKQTTPNTSEGGRKTKKEKKRSNSRDKQRPTGDWWIHDTKPTALARQK